MNEYFEYTDITKAAVALAAGLIYRFRAGK